jgi:osmotically-inducible protein OsmY
VELRSVLLAKRAPVEVDGASTVSKGWVTLKGELERQYQEEAAERDVRNLTGVVSVTNLITVKPRVTARS